MTGLILGAKLRSRRIPGSASSALIAPRYLVEILMIENSSVPQPAPGIYIPGEVPPMGLALGPDEPPEVDEPPLMEPTIPVREPGTRSPARASAGV